MYVEAPSYGIGSKRKPGSPVRRRLRSAGERLFKNFLLCVIQWGSEKPGLIFGRPNSSDTNGGPKATA